MSGISNRPRVEELQALRGRVTRELATTGPGRRRVDLRALLAGIDAELTDLGHPPRAVSTHPADPLVTVPLSHVNRRAIRAWSGGDPHRHGTLPATVLDAYAKAHRPKGPTG